MERLFLPFVEVARMVVTHIRPHVEEFGAWWLADRFGESIFPGIKSAKLALWDAGSQTPDGRSPRQWKEEDGAVLIGVGGAKTTENPDGAEFDEHGLHSSDTCAMTLMAQALGLTTEPSLRGMLAYARRNDRKGARTDWDLASVLKALNAHTLSVHDVARFAFKVLDANYNRVLAADGSWRPSAHAYLFDGTLASWLWDTFGGLASGAVDRPQTAAKVVDLLRLNCRADVGEIAKLAYRDHSKGATAPFDIVATFSELVENGADRTEQREFVYVVMNARFAQQRRFLAAMDEVRNGALVAWVGDSSAIARLKKPRPASEEETTQAVAELKAANPEADDADVAELKAAMDKPPIVSDRDFILESRGIRPAQIASIVSDNDEALSALRMSFPHAQFYIRRQTTRLTAVSGRKHLMDSGCAGLRIAESVRRNGPDGPRIPPGDLRRPGSIPNSPWYYHKEGGMVLNGSLTNRGADPTRLSMKDIWRAIAGALQSQARYDRRVQA